MHAVPLEIESDFCSTHGEDMVEFESHARDIQRILSQKVDDLELSVRTKNCLKSEEIIYVGDLVQKTEENLKTIWSLDQNCLREINECLRELDLRLGMRISDWQLSAVERLLEEFHHLVKVRFLPRLANRTPVKLLLTVEELDLSVRVLKCLKRVRVTYVGDLAQKTEAELLKRPNFGRKSLAEVKKKLASLGFNLGMRIPDWTQENVSQKLKVLDKDIRQERMRLAKEFRNNFEPEENTLEYELRHLTSVIKSERDRAIVTKLLGWDGRGTRTLAALGQEYGMTRERVRQIRNKFFRKLRRRIKTVYLPILTRALAFVDTNSPALAEEIEKKLVGQGLARTPFRLEGLLKTAKLFDLDKASIIVKVHRKRFVVPRDASNLPSLILQLARKTVEHWGVATVSDIIAQVKKETNQSVTVKLLVEVLSSHEDFSWLEKSGGWFWLSTVPKRNRVLNQIKKIISVADNGIDISELRSGIGRSRRMQGFAPPRRVLLELCRQVPWCRVDGNIVSPNANFNWEKILANNEWAICWVLKEYGEYGPVMGLEQFEEKCLEIGMNQITFRIYLGNSSIIVRHAKGVYGLRGAKIQPGIVESLMPNDQHRRVLLDYGWTAEGRIWLALKISRGLIATGVFGVPGPMKHFLQGKFTLKAADGAPIGRLKIKNSSGWSLSSFFRRRGGEPGDYLVLVFDRASREATAYIGDRDILDDFRPELEKMHGVATAL